ncbi:Nitrate reductase cytochrome c550-type subunit [hydrothermal vent metagenome]|uniref:Periplasmic nitrate reductase, electron transfer subunit n=1 Tax=hydrothermal vent metagenome TaxID=652676 RepID=A0A3B1BAV8_9ZZZZ
MKKKMYFRFNMRFKIGVSVLAGALFSSSLMAQSDTVTSLRGHTDLDQDSGISSVKKWQRDRDPIERDYVQQPPLIPHSTKGYKINIKFNKCLTCHSWANYKEAGATKISQTHFSDRDENVLANIAPRRYFCVQCHVPQVDAKPLVENTFEPVKSIQHH